jgi:tetratricopeptide (TPR) repeat protein
MSDFLTRLRGGSGHASAPAAWSLDRNPDRLEAQRLIKAGNFPEAERHMVNAVAEADKREFSAAKRVRLRLELVDVQRRQAELPDGDPDGDWIRAAEHTARQAITLAAQVNDSASYLACLDALTDIFMHARNWTAVENTAQEALELSAKLPQPDALQTAKREHRLGVASHFNNRPEEALQSMKRALEIHEQKYGKQHVETGHMLAEIGRVYRAQKDFDAALHSFSRAFAIHRDNMGEAAPRAIDDLQQWAGTLEERALMIRERQLGVNNIDQLAEMQYSLANLYINWDHFSRARELLIDCIGTFRRNGGARLAVCYETFAQVEEYSGRHISAIGELEKAAKAWEQCGPSRTRELVRNIEYRADLLKEMRKTREAGWLLEKAEALLEQLEAPV